MWNRENQRPKEKFNSSYLKLISTIRTKVISKYFLKKGLRKKFKLTNKKLNKEKKSLKIIKSCNVLIEQKKTCLKNG